MAQDIRELLKQDKRLPSERLGDGHELRFIEKLEKQLPVKEKKINYGWLRSAASVVVVLSVSLMTFNQLGRGNTEEVNVVDANDTGTKNSTVLLTKQSSPLAEISPEYEKVENYLLTSIKFELSQITIDDTNRELVESFMVRLENLDKEYQLLSKELIEVGPNTESVEAMIENQTLRLTLLNRLKDKLKELEKIENEGYNEIQA